MELTNYRLVARGKKWNDKDEKINMLAATPEQAITKARIVRGEDFYRRLYWIAVAPNRNMLYEDLWEITDLCGYGMLRELMIRDYGVKDANRRARA